jgi:hypothetical protein
LLGAAATTLARAAMAIAERILNVVVKKLELDKVEVGVGGLGIR